jgi:pimeloyl-ACP methyl ester carboxylesterase
MRKRDSRFCLRGLVLTLVIAMSAGWVKAQHRPLGPWEGEIALGGFPLGIRVMFGASGDSLRGTIDIPQQMAWGLSLRSIRYADPELHFELPAGPGLAIFNGVVRGDSIIGTFRQVGFAGTFTLVRRKEEVLPYRVEEVRFANDSITLAGTLTIPGRSGRHPAVVLIGGSGALSRDEEVFGFPVFRRLADSLTRRGFVVLRYDKRGAGSSNGNLMGSTVRDLAGDALAGFRLLESRNEVIREQICLLGHSEGGAVAALAAAENPGVAAIVVLGGTSVRGELVILDQIEKIGVANGTPRAEIDRDLLLERALFGSLKSGSGLDSIARILEVERSLELDRQMSNLTPDQKKGLPSADSLARQGVAAELTAVQTRWYRDFLEFDPASVIPRAECPIFALYGEKDVQVSPELNRPPMEAALREGGNPGSRVVVVPGANHLFQSSRTGVPGEYGVLKKEFVPGLVDQIVRWIEEQLPG